MPEEVVTGGPTTPTPAPAGDGTPNATPNATPTPAPAGDDAGKWDRERRGLIGETQKERAARQKLEGELNTLRAQHEQATKRIQALAGVSPRSAEETDDEEVRAAFKAKFPHLAELTAEDIQAIREQKSMTQQLKASTDAMWKKHTNQVIGSIHSKVADRLNSDVKDLTERQKQTLRREYIAFIEQGVAEGKDHLGRHEDGDEALLDEFVDAYLKDWQDPIRRSVTSTEANRPRPLPSGRGRSIATTQAPKIDFKNEKSIQDAAVEAFTRHGGSFGQ